MLGTGSCRHRAAIGKLMILLAKIRDLLRF